MQKTIDANDYTYKDLLQNGSLIHKIPALQRPYTWDVKNVEKLWDDIVENDEGYYVGSIVMIKGRGNAARDEIIDGQQRLTTLYLFLVALRNYISGKQEFVRMEEEIWDMLVKSRKNVEDEIKLEFTNKNSNIVFSNLVKGESEFVAVTDTQKRFLENLKKINEKLEKYAPGHNVHLINYLFKKICSLQVILIKCLDSSITYKLFESINSTGESLVSTDMIKNSIFQKLEKDDRAKEIEEGWQDMYQVFDEKSSVLKTYLRHHWISTEGYTSHAKLFDVFQERYKTKDKVYRYACSLFASAEVYKNLRKAKIEDLEKLPAKRFEKNEIKETLEFLSYLGVDQVYSPLLRVYNKDSKKFKKHLIKFTAFQFIYKYIPGSPSAIEKIFANYCTEDSTPEETFVELRKICKGQKENFTEKFQEKVRYRESKSGDIQFMLQRHHSYIDGVATFQKPTIEHIISKNLKNDDSKRFRDRRKSSRLVHQLGNLLILEEKENQVLGEKAYRHKEDFYRQHKFPSVQQVTAYTFSSDIEKAIERRTEDIASDLYDFFIKALEKGSWDIKK